MIPQLQRGICPNCGRDLMFIRDMDLYQCPGCGQQYEVRE